MPSFTLTVGVDVGNVMNPRHLTSMLERGAVMGVGEALFEEVTFDTSRVTSTDWSRYRIPRMADVPLIKTVFTSHNDRGLKAGGEAAKRRTRLRRPRSWRRSSTPPASCRGVSRGRPRT